MKNQQRIISIATDHIQKGIEKYKGEIDYQLKALIVSAGLQYTPYVFVDGRILLVLPGNSAAFLYPNKEVLYQTLSLS